MIKFEKHLNKQAKSYEIACKCAKTADIYNKSVLQANKYNANFLYHLRSLEIDVCKELLLHSIVRAENIGACTINILVTNRSDVLKVIVNADLDSAFEALDCDYYTKRAFKKANGEYNYIYEVKFNLTL